MPTRRELANVLRVLAMDAVQQANSGHPGAPMGMADIAEVLWRDFLKHNPANPRWWDRDRFILSNGHASMLLYALLHLTGYPLGMDEIRHFRQLGSRTAGHPEHDLPIGIETTTGPLGQGLANAVGFALAEKMLAAQFNRPQLPIVDHYTWVFAGDGCLMEGISHEACSLAGTLKLGKLIVFYDDNGISIDGEVQGWFADDTPKRFEAYGWHVQRVDGLDDAGDRARDSRRPGRDHAAVADRLQDRHRLGRADQGGHRGDARRGAGRARRWPARARSSAGPRRRSRCRPSCARPGTTSRPGAPPKAAGRSCSRAIATRTRHWRPNSSGACAASCRRSGPTRARAAVAAGQAVQGSQATRQSSQAMLNVLGPALPELFGGSADLTGVQQHAAQGRAAPSRPGTPRATTCITACASSA